MRFLSQRPDWQLLTLLVLLLIPIKALFTTAAGLEMHFDEAQYWEWSQQLDWSYYSKGPLIAWLIALGETMFGHGEWQTRLFGWLAHGLTLVVMFHFARTVWNSREAGWWAVAIMLLTPLYFGLSLVMTTDNLMLLFWSWGLWAVYRALIHNRPKAWYEASAAVGIGALTKLSIGLMPFMAGLLILIRPRWWHHLRNPHLWGSLLLMLVCMSPLILWNASNDWVMLRHEGGHVKNEHWSIVSALEFLAGQWLVLSPIVVTLMIITLWRKPVKEGPLMLWLLTLAWLGFFVFKAMTGKIQLNWASASYISAIVLFAGAIPKFSETKRKVLYGGFALSALLLVILFFPKQFGLAGDQDPFKKNKYWQAPIAELAAQLPEGDFILTDTYHLAAELAYYWPTTLPLYITGSESRRHNQHDIWPSIEREQGKNGLYIIEREHSHPLLHQAFAQCEQYPPLPVKAWDGKVVRTLYPYYCENYQHIEWPKPKRY